MRKVVQKSSAREQVVPKTPEKNLSARAQAFIDVWSVRIGPEYARLFLPIHRRQLLSIPIVFVGLIVAIAVTAIPARIKADIGALSAADINFGEISGIAIALAFTIPTIISMFQWAKFGLRIQSDLRAAGFKVKPSGPDLRSIAWFDSWSKRSGIKPDDIIAVGAKVLGDNSKATSGTPPIA